MEPHHRDLLDRITAFDIDADEPDLSFAARLSRENAWSIEFSRRVIDEYKRFVFLCMVSGHPCTPSEHVDQAWHLHLTYTRSYWERFCAGVLPRPLHHSPTRGGHAENNKFDDWYARTRESYERLLGSSPPSDIWPGADDRFGHDLQWSRVNHADYYVIQRRTVRRALPLLLAPVALVMAAAGVQTQQTTPPNFHPEVAAWILMGVGLLGSIVGFFAGARLSRNMQEHQRGFGIIAGVLIGGSTVPLLMCIVDRYQIVHLGIPQATNDPATTVGGIAFVIGCVCGLLSLVKEATASGGGSGGCASIGGGCGGGGCGGGCGG